MSATAKTETKRQKTGTARCYQSQTNYYDTLYNRAQHTRPLDGFQSSTHLRSSTSCAEMQYNAYVPSAQTTELLASSTHHSLNISVQPSVPNNYDINEIHK